MSCTATVDSFVAIDGTLDVASKYSELMTATLGDDSLYTRARENKCSKSCLCHTASRSEGRKQHKGYYIKYI